MSGWGGVVRQATSGDVLSINAIYNGYIVGSHVSFDIAPWTDDERRLWFDERVLGGFPILVAAEGQRIIGAAWAGPWRGKAAYRRTAETTIILSADAHRAGAGTRLYDALIAELCERDFHRCHAIIAMPNDAAVALHTKVGFTLIGMLDEVGHKDGRYISTLLLERKLGADRPDSA